MKYEETARRLRKALSDNNMKAQELADKCGINKASISQYVNGSHKPSNIKAAQMAEVLGVNALWLMGFDQPATSSDISSLSEQEQKLIAAFRTMNDSTKRQIVLMAAYWSEHGDIE